MKEWSTESRGSSSSSSVLLFLASFLERCGLINKPVGMPEPLDPHRLISTSAERSCRKLRADSRTSSRCARPSSRRTAPPRRTKKSESGRSVGLHASTSSAHLRAFVCALYHRNLAKLLFPRRQPFGLQLLQDFLESSELQEHKRQHTQFPLGPTAEVFVRGKKHRRDQNTQSGGEGVQNFRGTFAGEKKVSVSAR